jgi:hypothetical protein
VPLEGHKSVGCGCSQFMLQLNYWQRCQHQLHSRRQPKSCPRGVNGGAAVLFCCSTNLIPMLMCFAPLQKKRANRRIRHKSGAFSSASWRHWIYLCRCKWAGVKMLMTSLQWLRRPWWFATTPAATLCFARTLGHCVCCGTHTRGALSPLPCHKHALSCSTWHKGISNRAGLPE